MLVPRKGPLPWLFPSLLAGLAAIAAGAGEPRAHAAEPPKPGLRSLRGLTPTLPDLSGIVRDRTWAVVLGKALFFDEQLGSDGQACASCHYSAGADSRITNQLAPGKDDASPPDPATLVFGGLDMDSDPPAQTGLMASGNPAGADVTLVPEDFPFHQLVDPDDRDSDILFTTNDRVSSQGTFGGNFMGIGGGQSPDDVCSDVPDFVFHAGGARVRRVAGRNTPTNVNAIFNTRNFWDGRANGVFNGTGVFGRRDVKNDPAARVVVMKSNGAATLATLDLKNASAASQAAGPPGSSVEMACAGRKFALVGRKMFARQPLALQAIDPQDSVFGSPSQVGDIRAPCGHGLSLTYEDLVKLAFEPKLWKDKKKRRITAQGNVVPHPGGFRQRELNFPLFFGVAVMLYEATLVSDDTPVDRFFGCDAAQCGVPIPPDPSALTADEQAGLALFQGKGKCSRCHSGPLLTGAAHVEVPGFPPSQDVIARRNMADGTPALQDEGFFNTGVTPVHEDLGLGGTDPYGNPLSYTRQWVEKLRTGAALVDPFTVNPCNFRVPFSAIFCSAVPATPADLAAIRVAVDGAFKTPGLRNVALTPPYFHDGGTATLDQVIDFYNRGGNCRGPASDDSTGTGPLGDGALSPGGARGTNLGPAIVPLGLTAQEKAQLKAFMLALTDDRVRCRKAPFDGPELSIPNGHAPVDVSPADGRLDALTLVVPPTGAGGLPSWSCVPNTGDLFDVAPQ